MRKKHYDVIIMDIVLPGMDGVQTFEQVKEIDPRAAVIMITGYTEEDLMEKAIKVGSYTYMRKPFEMEKILAMLATMSKDNKK